MRQGWQGAVVMVLALVTALPGSAAAQADMAARLVGRWEGRVAPPPPPSPTARHPAPLPREHGPDEVYALVIDTVVSKDGGWTAHGTFGLAEGKRVSVTVTVTEGPAGPRLQFGHGRGTVTRLTLLGDGVLSGTLGRRGEWQEPQLTLRRAP